MALCNRINYTSYCYLHQWTLKLHIQTYHKVKSYFNDAIHHVINNSLQIY
jgi:hypothetical protein